MHGAAPPYAWPGFSSYEMYQHAVQGLQSPAMVPQAQSHLPHIPSVVNPNLAAPWINPDLRAPTEANLQKLQEVNGYPVKPFFETFHSSGESAMSALSASYTASERTKNSNDLYFSSNSSVYKPPRLEMSVSAGNFSGAMSNVLNSDVKDKQYTGFSNVKAKDEMSLGASLSMMRDVPSTFFPSMPPYTSEAANHLISNDTLSHLKWKNAYSAPSSRSCSTSLSVSSHLSTSAEFMPVTNTAASNSVIPYKPRDFDTYSVPNGAFNEAATKEAARILEEASLSNKKSGYTLTDRTLLPSFTNISNEQRQQSFTSAPEHFLAHKSSSSHSLHNTQLESPLDFRPETQTRVQALGLKQLSTGKLPGQSSGIAAGQTAWPIQGQSARPVTHQPAGPIQGDFWSEFGIPPPNVALDQSSQDNTKHGPKRSGSFLSQSDGTLYAAKKAKEDEGTQKSVTDMQSSEDNGKEKSEERKKSEKLTRRKSFTEDPAMDALVDAKVQEIMAACKEKELQKVDAEKPRLVKSPKHSSQTGVGLYEKQQAISSSLKQQYPCDQSFQQTSENTGKESVYDFNESDQHVNLQKKYSFNQKDLPQQVTEMRLYKKQKTSSAEVSYHMADQKPDAYPGMSLYDQISAMRTKTKFTHTHPEVKHVSSLHEQINEMQHSKQTPAIDMGRKEQKFDSVRPDASIDAEDIFNRQFNKKDDKSQEEVFRAQCCLDCNKSGKNFSENCQEHKQKNEDPFQFSDRSSSVGPYNEMLDNVHSGGNGNCLNTYKIWNNELLKSEHEKFVSSYEKVHAKQEHCTDIKGNVQYFSENKKVHNIHSQSGEKYNGFFKRGSKMDKMSQKLKTVSLKLERPQGQVSATKKFGSKPYGMKSSLALLKKSQKYHHIKLPSVRQKWRNNPKYKKVTKDDFAEKLMKNLGFPPLTLKDLMAKRHCKLPKEYVNGHATIAASMLSAENKAASRGCQVADMSAADTSCVGSAETTLTDETPQPQHNKETATHMSANRPELGSGSPKQKPFQRSKSADEPLARCGFKPVQRSWSFDDLKKEPAVSVPVTNDRALLVDQETVKTVSDQISDLHAKVVGHQSYLESNTVIDIPKCECLGVDGIYSETAEGPYYTHLGSGHSVEAIRKTLEHRTGQVGKAIRIEKVRYTGKEGKSKQGCPIAKWIVRRSGIEEKYLALVRHRANHSCETAWLIVGLVAWEGVPTKQADDLYDFLSTTLPPYGNETERRCGTNERKTCACQGADLMKRGASFSFGCSWSMYFNGCKFARSAHVRKFRLKNEEKESVLEGKLQDLATHIGPLYEKCAPDAHANQCYYSEKAKDCRLGNKGAGPFSGVTACVDYCAHAHKDIHNMNNGSTVVVTLTKHRGLSKPEDEQLHVLPMYVLDPTDEAGSYEGQYEKIRSGSLEVLHKFPLEARMRAHPLESCKKRRMAKKGRGGPRQVFSGGLSSWDSSSSTQSTPKKDYLHSQDSNLSAPSLNGSNSNTPIKQSAVKFDVNSDKPISYDDLMAVSTQAGFDQLYSKFWDYFYAFGVFPPPSILVASLQGSSKVFEKSVKPVNYDGKIRQQDNTSHVNAVPAKADCSVPSHMVKSQDNNSVSLFHGNSVQVENPFSDTSSKYSSRHTPAYGDVIDQGQVQRKLDNVIDIDKHSYSDSSIEMKVRGTAPEIMSQVGIYRPGDKVSVDTTYEQTINSAKIRSDNISTPNSSTLPLESGALDLSFSSGNSKPGNFPADISQSVQGEQSTGHSTSLDSQYSKSHLQYGWNGADNSTENRETNVVSHQSHLDLLSQAVEMQSKNVGFTGTVTYANQNGHSELSKGANTTSVKTSIGNDVGGIYHSNHRQYEQKQSSLPENNKHHNAENYNEYSKQTDCRVENLQRQEQRSSHLLKDISGTTFPSHMQAVKGPLDFASHRQYEQVGMNPGNQCWKPYDPQKLTCHERLDSVHSKSEGPSLLDPDVVKCEMEYNEEAFLDPDIGGVAVALCHGAVLFEVAKRELHATTGLKNPNRYHPTRISLVFYQHKNLNNERHGMYAYEKKLEDLKMKRIEKMQLERGYVDMKEIENSFKGGKKRKLTDEEVEVAKLLESAKGEYKYMWNCNTKRAESVTTETVSTKWIDPSPMVTGPYQKWV